MRVGRGEWEYERDERWREGRMSGLWSIECSGDECIGGAREWRGWLAVMKSVGSFMALRGWSVVGLLATRSSVAASFAGGEQDDGTYSTPHTRGESAGGQGCSPFLPQLLLECLIHSMPCTPHTHAPREGCGVHKSSSGIYSCAMSWPLCDCLLSERVAPLPPASVSAPLPGSACGTCPLPSAPA